jgi:hypothetical protein
MQYFHVEDIPAFNKDTEQIAQFEIARNKRNAFEFLYNSKTGHPMIMIADFKYSSLKYYTFINKTITVGEALDTLGLDKNISDIRTGFNSGSNYDLDDDINSIIDLPIVDVPLCQFAINPKKYTHSTINVFHAIITIKMFMKKYIHIHHSECGICYEDKLAFALHDDDRHALCYKCKLNVIRSASPSCPFCRKHIEHPTSSDSYNVDDHDAYYNDMYDNSYVSDSTIQNRI